MKLKIVQAIGLPLLILVPTAGMGAEVPLPPLTTRQQTIRPLALPLDTRHVLPKEVPLYELYGYSAWQLGPGEDQGRKLDLMPAGYGGSANAAQLLSFFTLSDIHITDKESPAQIPFFGWNSPWHSGGLHISAYAPAMVSTTHFLDAAIQTVNGLHRQTPFDFGIALGDQINSSQYNELRWFIDVMDGQPITPSSGDHLGATNIGYQMPYQAAGLDRSIPWYAVLGNHDQFWMGVGYPTDKLRQTFVGDTVLNMGTNPLIPGASEQTGLYMGVIDGSSPLGDVVKGGPTNLFPVPPKVAADQNRHTLTAVTAEGTIGITNYIGEFFRTASTPKGHGFREANLESNSACYTFEPTPNLPLKVIVFDNTCKLVGPTNGPLFSGAGWVDPARYQWLTNELQKGQESNQLMIIACHIPMNPQAGPFDTNQASAQFYLTPELRAQPQFAGYKTEAEMTAALHQYPNLLLVMAGHRHMNTVTPQPSLDPTHPENGYWEVETASLREFPQEFRTWRILRNTDHSISIVTTDVDPQVDPDSAAADSRDYAVGASRVYGITGLADTSSYAYNAELVKLLTPAMQDKIAAYGIPLRPTLSITREITGGLITFRGRLQTSDTIVGPWTEVPGATSPYPVSAQNGARYYRSTE